MSDEYIAGVVEEIVAERPYLSLASKSTLRKALTRLLKAAKPGNWAWRELENTWGFHGDYVYGQDEGMSNYDNK